MFELNVRLLGAKGDGATNDSYPIRFALQVLAFIAPPTGGGALYFPPGTYLVSKDPDNPYWCLDLPDKVMLRGSGRGATTLKLADNQDNSTRIVHAASRSEITIRDLTIDGNKLQQSGLAEQQHGIFLDTCSGTVIQNVAFQDNKGDSVYLFGNCTATVISGCQFTRGDRVHLHAHAFTNLTVTGCHFYNINSNNHIKQESIDPGFASSGASVTGCTFDGDSRSNGVLFAGVDETTITTDITVSGNVFRNLSWGVAIGIYTQGWSVVGNTIENCEHGIQNVTYHESYGYTANSHMQISGNLIRNVNTSNSGTFPPDNFGIFLSNCTVGSVNANTVYAPDHFQGIRIAHCSRVSVSGNTISVGLASTQGYAMGLVLYRCNNCSAAANLIDLIDVPPVLNGLGPTHPVGVWVSALPPYISTNIAVQNNVVLGSANPAIRIEDANPAAAVAVVGNLAPSAVEHLDGTPPLPHQPDVTDFTIGALATQRIKMAPRLVLPPLADSPPPIDDWNPSGIHSSSYVVLHTSSVNGAQLTGINAGYDGDYLYLVNYGPGAITFLHDTGSAPPNRFYLSGETSHTIPRFGHIAFRYDGFDTRWIQIG